MTRPGNLVIFWLMLILCLPCAHLQAQDMRRLQTESHLSKEMLLQKAAEEKAQAEREALENRRRIAADRGTFEKSVAELTGVARKLAAEVAALNEELARLDEEQSRLDLELGETDAMLAELVGAIRVNAKDVNALIAQDPRSALLPPVAQLLAEVAEQTRFPGMEDVRRLAEVVAERVRTSGEVVRQSGTVVDRSGKETEAQILILGPFTAVYRDKNETGFLNFVSADQRLYALTRLPSSRVQKELNRYMEGKTAEVPIDISRGAALRQLTHQLNFLQRIPTGGPIVWPILALLVVGIAIVVERVVFLYRKRFDADTLMEHIARNAAEDRWERCAQACEEFAAKPVARVLKTGLACRSMPREEIENALQETILREIPPMERALATLGMLATIAPLLGLLGTVTGMIHVFHVITLYGTGDPRLMAGGISEALVTTMLGLSVAIPLMLAHTLLNRMVDRNIGQMEEKAVALVNIVDKNRRNAC